jgi:hypothetical protein
VGIDLNALNAEGWRTSDTASTDYTTSLSNIGVATLTITVSCNGTNSAVWDASTGVVTPPAS